MGLKRREKLNLARYGRNEAFPVFSESPDSAIVPRLCSISSYNSPWNLS